MVIKPQFGIDALLFGMKAEEVLHLLGEPDRKSIDSENNPLWIYNSLQIRLTFYKEEENRLGYIVTTHPDAKIKGVSLIGKPVSEVISKLLLKWESEETDGVETYFNEDQWIVLQVEFDKITRVEIGAAIKNMDEFDWKV